MQPIPVIQTIPCNTPVIPTDTQAHEGEFTLVHTGPKRTLRQNTWSPESRNSFAGLPVEECSPIIEASTVDSNELGYWIASEQTIKMRGGEWFQDDGNVMVRRKSKRPDILTNEKYLHNYVPHFLPTRPGIHSYVEASTKEQDVLIISDSTMNRIRKHEFSQNLDSGKVLIKSAFFRAKLSEKRRSCVVVHGGTNSIVMFDGTVTDQSA